MRYASTERKRPGAILPKIQRAARAMNADSAATMRLCAMTDSMIPMQWHDTPTRSFAP